MFVRNAWYTAAWASEITDKPLARRLLGDPVVFFRDKAGKVSALLDSCCHRGAPLSIGRVVDEGLQCGYHGMVFDGTGVCVHIPGQDRIPQRAKVKCYPVVERQEFIWIWMGDPALADESKIIDYPYHDDYKTWPHKHGMYHIDSSYMLMVDNLMDLSHVGYVHANTIGGNAAIHVEAKMETVITERGVKFTRWMLDSVPPPTYSKAVNFKGNVDRWQEFEFIAPSHIVQYSGAKDVGTGTYEGNRRGGVEVRLIHALTPETETSCFYFWTIANGFRQDLPQITEVLFKDICAAFLEDKAIVELQQKRQDELGEDWMIEIAADKARVHMRKTVDRLIAEERNQDPSAIRSAA